MVILALMIIVGFLGGVVGELWLNGFLLPDPYLKFINYSDLSTKLDELLTRSTGKPKLNERDLAINETVQRVRPSVVQIYRYAKFNPATVTSLLPQDLLGQGVIITNDGWVLTTAAVVNNDKGHYWLVGADHKLYESQQVVLESRTGTAWIKVTASNWPVASFSLESDLVSGQSVLVFGLDGSLHNRNIQNLQYSTRSSNSALIRNSEEFYKYILLSETVPADCLGSPIVTLEGRVAGLIKNIDGAVVPIDYLTRIMKMVTQSQKISWPHLGVQYYDLTELLNPQVTEARGAWILKTRGVLAGSPAQGILLPDDIIIQVEREELRDKNLSQLLSQYAPGQEIKLLVKRAGAEKEVTVKLGGR